MSKKDVGIFPFVLIFAVFSMFQLLWSAVDGEPEPKALFTAVFWEKYKNESFSYAPWGNETEENASIVDISVGSSSLSRKFAYYGNYKLNLYSKKRVNEWEEENAFVSNNLKNLAAEFELPLSNTGTKEYLLLFTNKKKNGLWKIYPLSFSQAEIPFGSYKFVSQSRSTMYLIFGEEKITLGGGKSFVCPANLVDGQRGIMLKAMIQSNGKTVEIFSQRWGHSPKMRGIFFLGMSGKRMSVKRVVEFESPLSTASGFGLPPLKPSEQESDEVESNP
jgi:hypothetical protein